MTNMISASALVLASLLASQTAAAESGADAISIQTSQEDPKFDLNINSNPFYLLFGGVHAAVSFRLDERTTIGPVVSTAALWGSRIVTIGVQGQRSLQGQDVMSDGLILDSSIEFLSYSTEFYGETESYKALMAEASADWQWFYDNGFNMRIGIGLAAQMGLGDGLIDYSGVSGVGVFNLGDSIAAHGFLDADLAWAF